jgi:hypothetical protein
VTNERYESLIDRQIRLAAERGHFDNLAGAGKPLPGLDEPDDGLWWVRGYLRREGLSTEALLPPSVQLRKEIDRLPTPCGRCPPSGRCAPRSPSSTCGSWSSCGRRPGRGCGSDGSTRTRRSAGGPGSGARNGPSRSRPLRPPGIR